MKNFKARLLIAALAMLLIVLFSYALAEDVTTIRFEPQGGKTEYFVGDTIAIDVRLANNPGDMTSFVAAVDYDTDVQLHRFRYGRRRDVEPDFHQRGQRVHLHHRGR